MRFVTNKLLSLAIVSMAFLLVIFPGPLVLAAESDMTVTPIQVDGQRVTTHEIILPLDGQVHELTFSVTNFSSSPQVLQYQGVQASTNAQGHLAYDPTKKISRKVLLKFDQLIPKASLAIDSGDTKELKLSLDFRHVDFGEIMGALQLSSASKRYFVPLKLVGIKGVPPSKLAVTKISGQLLNKLPALTVTLQNQSAKLLEQGKVNLMVVHSQFFGLVKKSWQIKLADVTWAPNGELNYPIPMNGTALQSGRYQITGTIGEKERQVNVEEAFTLTRTQTAAINQQAPEVNDATLRWGIPVLIGLTVILILVITVALRQHKKSIRNKR